MLFQLIFDRRQGKMNKAAEKEIKSLMHSLKCICVREKIPMLSVIQYSEGKNVKTYAEIVSPALVDFDTDNHMIYDCTNILNGQFVTVPSKEKEEIDF